MPNRCKTKSHSAGWALGGIVGVLTVGLGSTVALAAMDSLPEPGPAATRPAQRPLAPATGQQQPTWQPTSAPVTLPAVAPEIVVNVSQPVVMSSEFTDESIPAEPAVAVVSPRVVSPVSDPHEVGFTPVIARSVTPDATPVPRRGPMTLAPVAKAD